MNLIPSDRGASGRGPGVLPVMVGLAAVVALAYANTWTVPFLFDDHVTLRDNPALGVWWPPASWLQPPAHTGVGGRPLAHLTFLANHAVSGEALAGYHAGNLLLHLLAGLALFGLVRRTLLLPGLADRWGGRAADLALAVAAGWLLHPVQTASVTYLSQRTEILVGLCYLGTLYCFVRGAAESSRPLWLILAAGCCLAGMAAKEVMVTAPVMLWLYDRTFLAGTFREAWRRRGRWHAVFAATWIPLVLLLPGLGGRGVGYGHGMEWWEYALREGRAILGYLGRALWPHPLVFDHGVDFGPLGALEWLGAGTVLLLAGAALVGGWRSPRRSFLLAWFLLVLAPTSSVVPIPLQPVAENRVYLPLAAVVTALVLGTAAVLGRPARWIGGGLMAALIALTLARNHTYRSEVALWQDTAAKVPASSRARHNLGNALRDAGRWEEAEREFRAALRLRPDYADAAAALGGVLGRMGRHDEAIRLCRRALELDARLPDAHNNLGGALWQTGDLTGAIAAYETAVRLRPGFAEAQANLAMLRLRVGRPGEAVTAAEAALRLRPGWLEVRLLRAAGLAGAGRWTEAAAEYGAIVRVRPGDADAGYNLGTALIQLERYEEAAAVLGAVVRLRPDHAEAHSNLSHALLSVHQSAAALAPAEAAVRLKPDLAAARLNLGRALRAAGRTAEARAQFEAALRLDPGLAGARAGWQELAAPR